MNLTTIVFKGMLSFRFVGCQLNLFMVNSHMPYDGMLDKQVVDNAIKGKNHKLLANQTCVHLKCTKSC